MKAARPEWETAKAGEEVRTPDIQLGKLTLYQLSYAREARGESYLRRRGAVNLCRPSETWGNWTELNTSEHFSRF
jgi:hypothetical protein